MNATARRVLTLALCLWGAYDLAHAGRGTLLDNVDLAIHETGHLVFFWGLVAAGRRVELDRLTSTSLA